MKKVIIAVLLVIAAVVSGCGRNAAEDLAIDWVKLEEKVINTGAIPDKETIFQKYCWEGSTRSAFLGEQAWLSWATLADQAAANGLSVSYDVVDITSKSVMDQSRRESSPDQLLKQKEIGMTDIKQVDFTLKITARKGSEKKEILKKYSTVVAEITNPKRLFILETVVHY